MKHIMLLTAAVLFAGLRLAAADTILEPNLPDPDEPVEIHLSNSDANKEIKAKVGNVVVIELDGNTATSGIWHEMPGRTDSVLEFQGQEYKHSSSSVANGMVGIGDKAFFSYLVKTPGKTEVKIGLSRPWEQDKPPLQLFNVRIVAEVADVPAAGKTYEMTKDDNGKSLKINVGDVVSVKIKSNRTTGYSWAQITDKTDDKVLKSNGGEYKVDEHPAGMVGVGGNEIWTFSALAPGKTEIVLGYARPWEKDKDPAQTFKLTVEVDKAAAPAAESKANDAKAADTKTAPAVAKEVRLNDGDNGKTVKVGVGGTVVLTLEANPTTGFSWTKVDKVDQNILKLERNDYKQNANPAGMVGVGGRTTIVYRALKKGKAKIDLTYMQPWEPDSQFNTDYAVTVEVE